jgi:chromosome segregation ATPase
VQKIQKYVQKMHTTLKTTQEALHIKEQEVTQLQEQLKTATNTSIQEKKQIELLKQEKQTALEQLKIEHTKYEALSNKCDLIKKQIHQTEQENINLSTQLTSKIGELTTSQNKSTLTVDSLNKIKTELAASKTQYEKLVKEHDTLQKNYYTAQQTNTNLTQELKKIKEVPIYSAPIDKTKNSQQGSKKPPASTATALSTNKWRYSTYSLLSLYILTLVYCNQKHIKSAFSSQNR